MGLMMNTKKQTNKKNWKKNTNFDLSRDLIYLETPFYIILFFLCY